VIWLYMTLVVSCTAIVGLLRARRSRFVSVAVVALVLAVIAFLGGLSIGYLVAPVALLLSTLAVGLHLRANHDGKS
jgi:hypothetical protein